MVHHLKLDAGLGFVLTLGDFGSTVSLSYCNGQTDRERGEEDKLGERAVLNEREKERNQ